MKNTAILGIIVMLVSSFISCTHKQIEFGIEKDIIISGKITNYDSANAPHTIEVIPIDLFDEVKYVEQVHKDGSFKVVFPIAYTQEFYLRYGNIISLLCEPGDSLYINIDNGILKSNKPQKHIIGFSDNNIGKTNALINKFQAELPNEQYIGEYQLEAERAKTPDEFKNYIKTREQSYYTFLQKFKSKNATTKLFDNWANDHLKYESWNDLMRYRWAHPLHNQEQIDSFNLPEDYFTFLQDYNMYDNHLFSATHSNFLHEFSMYASLHPKDSLQKARSIFQTQGPEKTYDVLQNMIALHASGFTKDLFLTKQYVDLLKGQQLQIFEAIYDSSFTTQSYFLNQINTRYQALKDYLSNQNTAMANFANINASIVNGLIDTISQRYKGKLIYIDFWAPWCVPCMEEIPFSKGIQEYFAKEDIVFLFLANRCKENAWKATIANQQLTGEHMLLTDDQFSVLSGLLGITGIPHYTLIDKKGNILLKDAPRPSSKDKLIAELKKYL